MYFDFLSFFILIILCTSILWLYQSCSISFGLNLYLSTHNFLSRLIFLQFNPYIAIQVYPFTNNCNPLNLFWNLISRLSLWFPTSLLIWIDRQRIEDRIWWIKQLIEQNNIKRMQYVLIKERFIFFKLKKQVLWAFVSR